MIETGERLPSKSTLVRAESMPVWAAALRDPNPIHLNASATLAAGLGERVINQGPANVGYVVNILLDRFPNGRIEAMEFRFVDNVRAGDIAVASGTIGKVIRVDSGVRAECLLELEVDGRTVLSGTAWIGLPA